jgi:hypothetical protein
VAERNGNPPLEPGIYALCEVESEAFGLCNHLGWARFSFAIFKVAHYPPF